MGGKVEVPMEFKIQVSYDGGKVWYDGVKSIDFDYMKSIVNRQRKRNPDDYKYRIVGREILPWCEIKEGEVKYE